LDSKFFTQLGKRELLQVISCHASLPAASITYGRWATNNLIPFTCNFILTQKHNFNKATKYKTAKA